MDQWTCLGWCARIVDDTDDTGTDRVNIKRMNEFLHAKGGGRI